MLSQCARFIRRLCFTRRALTVACFLLVAAGVALFYSNWLIVNASQHLTWNDIQTVPARNVGLVLGAKPGNRYFTRRINTAAALYHAGKVKWLLVSGDNGKKEYDEPSAMQQALIAKGVPEAAIFCDYAGFSTLDSVVRARKVFGESRIRRGDLFKISEERCKKVKSAVRQQVNKNTIQDRLSTKQPINTRSTKHSR